MHFRGIVLFPLIISMLLFLQNGKAERLDFDKYHLADTTLKERYQYSDKYSPKTDSLIKTDIDAYLDFLDKLYNTYSAKNNWEGVIHVITEQGIEYYINSKFDSAILKFSDAIDLAEVNLGLMHPAAAKSNYYMAQCYFYKGNTQKALISANTALETFQSYYGNNNTIDVANTYRALGNIYQYLLADYFNAEKMYGSAIEILEFLNSPNEDIKFRLYYNLGVCNRKIYDYDKSFTYSSKALGIIENKEKINKISLELCLAINANSLIELDSLNQAITVLEKAVKLNYENFDNNSNKYLVQHLSNLGFIYLSNGDLERAEYFFREGLTICNSLNSKEDLLNKSTLYMNLGNLYEGNRENKEAIAFYNKSLDLRLEVLGKKHLAVGNTLKSLGKLYHEDGQYLNALKIYQDAFIASITDFNDTTILNFPTQLQLKNSVSSIQLVNLKANALLAVYKKVNEKKYLNAALIGFNLADSLTTIYQDIYSRETTKLRFLDLFHDIYEGGIEAAYLLFQMEGKSPYLHNAFYLMENSKAKLLTESFKKAQIEKQVGLPDSLIQVESSINQQIAYYQQEDNQENVQEKLFELDSKKRQLAAYIKEKFPDYYTEKFRDTPFSISELQQFLKKENQVLFSYYVGKQSLYKVIVTKDSLFLDKVLEDIKPYIDVLYSHLQKGYMIGNREAAFKEFTENNIKLSELLIGDASTLSDTEGLIVSTDHSLSYIPFEVLFTQHPPNAKFGVDYRSLPYLIKEQDVQYTYSAAFLLGNKGRNTMSSDPSVLGFSYSAHTDKGKQSNFRKMMATIPGAPIELDAIKAHFKGDFLYGAEANETVFKNKAAEYNILHLAIHGTANPEDTYGAYLQFRIDGENENDGRLYNYELYNLKFKASLAVLSACESGVGKMNRGEGLLSIGRGFAYAGCPATMMSLWQVNDNATSAIISNFYKNLEDGKSIRVALKLAKLSYIQKADELTAHPAYWAPMVTYGFNSSIQKNYSWVYILIASLLILSFILFKKSLAKKS